MIKIAGYVRCSLRDAEAIARSVSDQVQSIMSLANHRGFTLGAIMVDITRGTMRGSELARALDLARRGELHALVAAEPNRLSRDCADLRTLTIQLVQSGCDLVFARP